MWRTFCLIFLGANVASAALLRHDQKVSRADGKVQEKDLLDMLTSLNEVVVGMDKEHKAFRDLSNARETSCRTTKAKLEKSLKDGNSSLLTAKQELSNAMSEVDSIQGGVDSIKKQVKAIDGEISGLQEQLAKLRADRQAAVARDSGYTQQVKAILEKAQQRISQVWTRSGAHKSAKSQEEESEDGASLVSLSESDQDDDPEKRTAATEGKKALAADAASVTKAAKKAREAFELQELKLLDLIKSKRQALKPLQGNLAKQQPELADQLRKISEANRSVAMTKHALKRDQKVLERSQSKCAVLSKAKKFEEDQRPQVRVQVIMAISFLKAMARKAGIDLKPGAVGPSFLQLDSKDSELSEAVRSALHHIESLDDSRYEVNFQAEASNESDDAVTVPLESNLVQVDAAQKAASSEAADSLKNVKEMIANLIASLREEQNEDQGKQKFCADQLKKAQEKTKKLKTAQEEVEQSKRWAENAVNDLKVQSRFIEGEVKLLKEAKTSSKEELDAEEKRVKDEVKNHEATTDVMSKSQQVLVTQCELSDDLSSNCAEANAALRRATNGLKELDKYLASYLVEFSKVAEEQQAAIDKTLSAQEGSLFQTKADLNRRKDELAQLNAALVLAPTRELARQIQLEALRFGRSSGILCCSCTGGESKADQLEWLKRGCHIIVATPGRLNEFCENKQVWLGQISYLTLDEADRMLDMGFEPQIRRIIEECPRERQTLLFSATWPKAVRQLAFDFLQRPVHVHIGEMNAAKANTDVTQHVVLLERLTDKDRKLDEMLSQHLGEEELAIVFVSTKRCVQDIARLLWHHSFGVAEIHGDKDQRERDLALRSFTNKEKRVMVATDVASRGLDIKGVKLVINYDAANTPEDYVHRIGRTGRAGEKGLSYTFLVKEDPLDLRKAKAILEVMQTAEQEVPEELRELVGVKASKASKGGRGKGGGKGGKKGGFKGASKSKGPPPGPLAGCAPINGGLMGGYGGNHYR